MNTSAHTTNSGDVTKDSGALPSRSKNKLTPSISKASAETIASGAAISAASNASAVSGKVFTTSSRRRSMRRSARTACGPSSARPAVVNSPAYPSDAAVSP